MLVSNNNNLLNILLPSDNKVLKEALKDADVKTMNNIKNGNTSVADILKNLFNDAKTGAKSNATIENLLKNSAVFKDLGSFSKSITTLLNQIDSDANLAKFKPILQSFLKDIATLDDKALKNLMTNSGVFLESKALNQVKAQTNLPANLENILNQLKTILKDIPSMDARKIETLIDKILQNNPKVVTPNQTTQMQNSSDMKSLVSMLQNLSKNVSDKQLVNLTTLTNSLKNISSEAQLIESKISNLPTQKAETQQTNVNQNLNQRNIPLGQNEQLTQRNTNVAQQTTLQSTSQQQVSTSTQTQTNIPQAKEAIVTKTLDTLVQLKNELISNKNIPNSQNILKQIDSLLQNNDLFSKTNTNVEAKTLINQLTNLNEIKVASSQNSNINQLVNNLKTQAETITTLENKVLQNQNVQSEKLQLTSDIKQTLTSLKNELVNIPNMDNKVVNQIIDKLLNLQNIFSKMELPLDLKSFQQTILNQTSSLSNFQSVFSSNVNELILTLKESITNLSTNQNNLNLQNTIIKTVEKLEGIINNFLQNINNMPTDKTGSNPLQNDFKAVLLQLQNELASKSDPASLETQKQVEKMISQVEYHQLLSATSNSNNVYIPFIWDMLEEGSIAMKKVDEEKFYCEINLSLKEFGQTQLMLALYDKNKLDLTIYASKDSFKQAIRENSTKLKQALNTVDLIPVNFKIIDLKKEEEKPKEQNQVNAFNQDANSLGFGVNIKV